MPIIGLGFVMLNKASLYLIKIIIAIQNNSFLFYKVINSCDGKAEFSKTFLIRNVDNRCATSYMCVYVCVCVYMCIYIYMYICMYCIYVHFICIFIYVCIF